METIKTINYQYCGIVKSENVGYDFSMNQDKDIDRVLQRIVVRLIDERFEGNQAAFCRSLGLNPTYINAVVKGKKNLGKANWEKIRKALNLRTEEFLQGEDTSIVRDPGEQTAAEWYRGMKAAGMQKEAELMMEYAVYRIKKATPPVASESLERKRKILLNLYAQAKALGKEKPIEDYLKRVTAGRGEGVRKKKKAS